MMEAVVAVGADPWDIMINATDFKPAGKKGGALGG